MSSWSLWWPWKVLVGVFWAVGYPSMQFNLNFLWRQNEWQVLRMYSATCRSHSVATDGPRTVKLVWAIAWLFICQMHQLEKSCEFKRGEYDCQSTRVHNSANNSWVVLAVGTGAESAKRCVFRQGTKCCLKSSWYTSGLTRSPDKIGHFKSTNLPLILLALLLSAPSP
jgi:hypothetical protein